MVFHCWPKGPTWCPPDCWSTPGRAEEPKVLKASSEGQEIQRYLATQNGLNCRMHSSLDHDRWKNDKTMTRDESSNNWTNNSWLSHLEQRAWRVSTERGCARHPWRSQSIEHWAVHPRQKARYASRTAFSRKSLVNFNQKKRALSFLASVRLARIWCLYRLPFPILGKSCPDSAESDGEEWLVESHVLLSWAETGQGWLKRSARFKAKIPKTTFSQAIKFLQEWKIHNLCNIIANFCTVFKWCLVHVWWPN